jgi:PAS domain S-box-containing protein
MAISDMETRRFIEVSEGYSRILGYSREEMIGHTGVELDLWVHEKDRVRFLSDFTAERGIRDYEVEARRRDGKSVFILLSGEIFELNGRECGLTTIVDITARRMAELERNALEAQLRQAQKLEALGQLAGGIAHDFNNILTGIGAYSELALMDAERPPQVRKYLAQVRRAAVRATDLVRQILTFSRQSAQERRATRLPPVIGEALKLLRSSIPRSIEIVEEIDDSAPVVLADATQLHQVVMNLCTNAAHAMRDRPGRLIVELGTLVVTAEAPGSRVDLVPGRYARLVVSDTGHGMDEATLSRIFEPFFTTKAPGEGTGLGLSVVHGIVEDHDGIITVRSQRGEGTTFEICLPEHVALVPAEIESNPDIPRGRGERILYVDDETVVGEGVAEILRRLGYRVTLQKEAKMAVVLFDAAPAAFDVVVTDLAMPQLTGIEFARRVLARRPDIPVVLATGHLGAWSPEALQAIGIRGWIAKPITSTKIAHALREALTTAPASAQPAAVG